MINPEISFKSQISVLKYLLKAAEKTCNDITSNLRIIETIKHEDSVKILALSPTLKITRIKKNVSKMTGYLDDLGRLMTNSCFISMIKTDSDQEIVNSLYKRVRSLRDNSQTVLSETSKL